MITASSAVFDGREREYVLDCLARGWITNGKYVREFEERFAELSDAKHAIACSSGTAALHLAMLGLDIGPGCKVVVPALTYIATANAVKYCGADVVFCDIDPVDWCISPYAESACENPTAVVPVDMYDALASRFWRTTAVADAAHAPRNMKTLRRAAVEVHSFYASKVIACGEGGMVTTDDDEIARRARLFRGQGATRPGRYYHSVVGYNYRMTDLQAAVGLAQLERFEEIVSIRRSIVDRYRSNLSSSYPLITLQGGERASGWAMAILVPLGVNRNYVANLMIQDGVETRPFFEPIPSLPPYRSTSVPPISASVAWRGLVLPTHTALSAVDVDRVCESLINAVEKAC